MANSALSKIKNITEFIVKSIKKKRVKNNPTPPFITSTLQQEASRKLGFGAKNTMGVAQSLYQGVEINGETIGLITYMRTDSLNISKSAIQDTRDLIVKNYGQQYLPENTRIYKSKSSNAQEAHEAIRPTNIKNSPQEINKFLDDNQKKLYELIWKRTVASQMESAEIDQVTINIGTNETNIEFKSTGSTIVFDGYKKIYTEDKDDIKEDDDNSNKIPKLEENERLSLNEITPIQHFTEPPPRFTEASLVKKLEDLGIGRPSTYSSIVSVIKDKGYVNYEKEDSNLKLKDA